MPLKRLLIPAVLVLLALASILPAIEAAEPPEEQPWNPATPGAPILDLAASRDGSRVVVGLEAVQADPQTQQAPSTRDVSVVDFTTGAVWNRTCGDVQDGLSARPCVSRTHVAISGTGTTIAVGEASGRLELRGLNDRNYTMLSGWPVTEVDTGGGTNAVRPVTAVALSDDGQYVAVATGSEHGNVNLTLYHRNGQQQWRFPTASDPHAGLFTSLAFSRDGNWLVAGGARIDGDATEGVVYAFDMNAGQPNPGGVFLPTPVTSVAVGPDGVFLAAGSEDGTVRGLLRSGGANVFAGKTVNLTAPVHDVSISGATSSPTVAAAHAGGVSHLDRDPQTADLRHHWTAEVSGGALDVDLSHAGDLLVAASPAGALGFTTRLATPLYTLTGARTYSSIGPDGGRAIFASGTEVTGFTHLPATRLAAVNATGAPLTTPPVPTATLGVPAVFHIAIENNGTATETGRLTLPAGGSATITSNITTYTVRPGERAHARVTVDPGNEVPGLYDLAVHAVSDVTDRNTTLDLQYRVGAVTGLTLTYTGETVFVAKAGDDIRLDLGIHNIGNKGANVTLQSSQDPSAGFDWPLTVVPTGTNHTFLGRNAASPATVTIHVPDTAADGTTNDVRVVAVSSEGDQSSPLDVSVIVNPHIAANLTTAASIGRLVQAGQAAWYNLTLENTGSVEATYEVSWQVESSPRVRVWNQDVEGLDEWGRVTLAPGGSIPLLVKLHAPRNAEAGDAATIYLRIENFDAAPVPPVFQEWLNLSATVIPGDNVVTDDNGAGAFMTPGPGIVAVLFAAAAAMAGRRRWSS